MTKDTLRPIRKVLVVKLSVEDAFGLFTRDIGEWWPLHTHSLELDRATGCVLEAKEGGQLYETARDAPPQAWGHVVTWTPPTFLSFTWQPGDLQDSGTLIQIRFSAIGERRSRMELTHSGWLPHQLDRYVEHQIGWDAILVKGFQAHAQRFDESGRDSFGT